MSVLVNVRVNDLLYFIQVINKVQNSSVFSQTVNQFAYRNSSCKFIPNLTIAYHVCIIRSEVRLC